MKTERLILRQLSVNDDEEIFALRSNPEVNKYLGRQPADSIDDARKFINNIDQMVQSRQGIYWAITIAGYNKVVGTICLFNFSSENEQVEIGFELLPTYQGQGIMQDALEKVISFAADVLRIKNIEAHTHLENERSTKLLEKFNFKKKEKVEADPNNRFVSLTLALV